MVSSYDFENEWGNYVLTVMILKNEWGNYALTVMIFIVVFILLRNEASNKIENLCLDCYNWNSKTSQNIPF